MKSIRLYFLPLTIRSRRRSFLRVLEALSRIRQRVLKHLLSSSLSSKRSCFWPGLLPHTLKQTGTEPGRFYRTIRGVKDGPIFPPKSKIFGRSVRIACRARPTVLQLCYSLQKLLSWLSCCTLGLRKNNNERVSNSKRRRRETWYQTYQKLPRGPFFRSGSTFAHPPNTLERRGRFSFSYVLV